MDNSALCAACFLLEILTDWTAYRAWLPRFKASKTKLLLAFLKTKLLLAFLLLDYLLAFETFLALLLCSRQDCSYRLHAHLVQSKLP